MQKKQSYPSIGQFTILMADVRWQIANSNTSTIEIYNMMGEKVLDGMME